MENKYQDFIDKLYKIREISLSKDGEYGLGNLLFKKFRDLGYLDTLKQRSQDLQIKELSEKLKNNL